MRKLENTPDRFCDITECLGDGRRGEGRADECYREYSGLDFNSGRRERM